METLGNREALKIKKLKNWEIGKLRNPVVRKSDPPKRLAAPAWHERVNSEEWQGNGECRIMVGQAPVMTGPRNRVAFSEKRLRIPQGIKGLLACVLKIKHHWYFSISKL